MARNFRSQIAAVSVELSIALPIFFAFAFGALELSLYVDKSTLIESAAIDALREASTLESNCEVEALNLLQAKLNNLIDDATPATVTYTTKQSSDPTNYPGPYGTYKYLQMDVDIDRKCLTCGLAFGIGGNMKNFKKTYIQILPGNEPPCFCDYSVANQSICSSTSGDIFYPEY